jgi:glycine/D-amino acid oxidase-like deaminating enzyme/nitrite reductase/ring-hydroxylating ferredoxin subunit
LGVIAISDFREVPGPYWIASSEPAAYPALETDISVDIGIVGGGICGITSAYLLSQEGLAVAVVEADRILQGTTGHTTAKITSQHTLIYDQLTKQNGREKAQQYAEANETAIRVIKETIEQNQIDCDFVERPAYVYTHLEEYVNKIEREVDAASKLGINAHYLDDIPLPFKVKAAMRFDGQAQFHPLKYLYALAQKATENGVRIFEQSPVVDIEEEDPHAIVTRRGPRIHAARIIIASHYPFYDGGGLYFTRVYPERSYVVGVTIKERFPAGMFITAEDPVRSLRSQVFSEGELILVGGESHKTGQGKDMNTHYKNLIEFAQEHFQVKDIFYRWSTHDCMTVDKIPYVGHLTKKHPSIYVATGFGKWGFTNSTASAMILRDLITTSKSSWLDVYDPSRFNLASVPTFIKENADVAKHFFIGKVVSAPAHIEQIGINEARVVDIEGERMGAYRDETGEMHMVDLTCPHLGCELQWNDAERTWDCPCHGSRFTYKGDIVEGPALHGLHHSEGDPNIVEPNVFK